MVYFAVSPKSIKTSSFASYSNTGKFLSNKSIYLGYIFLVTTSVSGIRNIIRYVRLPKIPHYQKNNIVPSRSTIH